VNIDDLKNCWNFYGSKKYFVLSVLWKFWYFYWTNFFYHGLIRTSIFHRLWEKSSCTCRRNFTSTKCTNIQYITLLWNLVYRQTGVQVFFPPLFGDNLFSEKVRHIRNHVAVK